MHHLAVVSSRRPPENERVIDPLIRARVKDLRERQGLTQAQLAAKAGVAPNTVGGLEAGRQTRWPQFELIAKALGVTTHALHTGEGLTDENPLAKRLRLSDEALRHAKRFQDSETRTRLVAKELLRLGRRHPMWQLWDRVNSLGAHRRETLFLRLAEDEKAHAEEVALARKQKKKS
jgi:transcriptional regulator with XRE-family HTH domain